MVDRDEHVTQQTTVDDEGRTTTTKAFSSNSDDEGIIKVAQVVWFIVGVLVFLLILRMVLSLLGANPENAFADLIYSLSSPLVAPFRGLLSVDAVELGVSRFETETLAAVIVYTLFGWGIVKLISLGSKNPNTVA